MKTTRQNNKMGNITHLTKDTPKPPMLWLPRYRVNKWVLIVLRKCTNINRQQKWNYLIIVNLKNKVIYTNILASKNKSDLPSISEQINKRISTRTTTIIRIKGILTLSNNMKMNHRLLFIRKVTSQGTPLIIYPTIMRTIISTMC